MKQYISTGLQYKILFLPSHDNKISYVNIGNLMAKHLEHHISDKNLSFLAEEAIEKIIKDNACHSSEIGDYIAICNIGILFEPALRLNLHAKFKAWSKKYVLFIKLDEGMVENNTFYLSKNANHSYSINLSDLSFIKI